MNYNKLKENLKLRKPSLGSIQAIVLVDFQIDCIYSFERTKNYKNESLLITLFDNYILNKHIYKEQVIDFEKFLENNTTGFLK